jgi:ribosomal protein S6--L-glutamate ligase
VGHLIPALAEESGTITAMTRHVTIIDRETSSQIFPHDLVRDLTERGAEVQAVPTAQVGLHITEDGITTMFAGLAARTDVVITRRVFLLDEVVAPALFNLERAGVRVCNPTAPATIARDKGRTAELLIRSGVATVPTLVLPAAPASDLEQMISSMGSGPLVVKPATSGGGAGVVLCADPKTAARHLEHISQQIDFSNPEMVIANSLHYVVQPYVGAGRDARVFILDGEPLAMTRRTAGADFRTNGAHAAEVEAWWDASVAEVAVEAVKAIGLEYAGVDVIPTDNGPLVLEVNGWPGFASTAAVTGVDITGALASYLLR